MIAFLKASVLKFIEPMSGCQMALILMESANHFTTAAGVLPKCFRRDTCRKRLSWAMISQDLIENVVGPPVKMLQWSFACKMVTLAVSKDFLDTFWKWEPLANADKPGNYHYCITITVSI